MQSAPPSTRTTAHTESQHKKQLIVALPASAQKPKTPQLKSRSPPRDNSPKAIGRSARKLEAALESARQAYEKEQQVMRQLQQEHQTQLHDLLKKRLEFEEAHQAHEDIQPVAQSQSGSSQPFVPYAEHEASPGKNKGNARVRIHLSPPPAHLPLPPSHSPFMAVAEHFDRQQSIYDAQVSISKTLFHSPLATSLLSSVKSRLSSSWLMKEDGADTSGVGKLAAHAREWCFPAHTLPESIAPSARAAIGAARGEEAEASFDSIFSAPAMTKCYQSAGLFKSHRLATSRGLLEVALAATADESEQPMLHSVVAGAEWHGGVAVTVTAYAQPCKFPAYALKFAAKLRCINFPRIEPFVGVIVSDEHDCNPVASVSVSEGITLTEYVFKERHSLSSRDKIDLAVDVASAVAFLHSSGLSAGHLSCDTCSVDATFRCNMSIAHTMHALFSAGAASSAADGLPFVPLPGVSSCLRPPPYRPSRYTSTDASDAIVSYLVPPEMCAAWSIARAGLVFGSSCCQLEIEAASDGAVVDLVTYSAAARPIPGGSDSEAKHVRCRLIDEQRGDMFQLAVLVLQIISPHNYGISHSSIKHSLALTQAVDQQLLAARAVAPALESLLRSCLSPNVHARPSAEQFLRSLRALMQVPPYCNAKVWMRMGTDAASVLTEVSEKVDHTLAAHLATLRVENESLRKELEVSQQNVQAKVREEIRLAQEFLEQRNDELRIETRKRQQFQTSYFTAKAEKEISEQERNKMSEELKAAQETISKLLQRDKRSRTLLEETRSKLVEQHDNERTALTAQLEQSRGDVCALQQRVQLLLDKNGRLEERLVHLSDDCAELRKRNEKLQQELLRFQESTAVESAASGTIKDMLAATKHQLAASQAEAASLKLNMGQLRGIVEVSERCIASFAHRILTYMQRVCSARISSQKEFSHVLSWAQALLCSVCAALYQAATSRADSQPSGAAASNPANVRAAAVEHWERDAASALDVLGAMEPVFCEVRNLKDRADRHPHAWQVMAGVRSVNICATFNVPPILPLLATLCPALSHIQMHDCSMFSEAALSRFLPSHRHLQQLHLQHAPGLQQGCIEGVLELCPALVSLRVVDAPNLVLLSPAATDVMFQLSVASSNITDLQLERCPQVSPRWVEMLVKRMNLSEQGARVLMLSGCSADGELLRCIMSRSAAKRVAKNADAAQFSAMSMPLPMLIPLEASRNCPLVTLSLTGDCAVERMRDDDVGALIAGCISLRQLSLTGLHAVGVATAFAISSLPKLQRLLLLECRGIDDDFCITMCGALSSHLPVEAEADSVPGMRPLRPAACKSSSDLIELRITGAAVSDAAPILLSCRHQFLVAFTIRAGAVHRDPCNQKHQAHLLPYLLAPSPIGSSAGLVEEWLIRAQRILQFVLDPSQHVETLALDASARAQADMLMKCSLTQLTPQGLFYALGQLRALAHVEIGGEHLEWSADGIRRDNPGACTSLGEAVASSSVKRLCLTQSRVIDSVVVSSSAHIRHTLRLLQHLTQLDFSGCSSLSDEVLSAFASAWVSSAPAERLPPLPLTHLNLNGCCYVTSSGMLDFLPHCARLQTLRAAAAPAITPAVGSALGSHCRALTDLDVSGCAGAGDAFLLQLLGGRFWDVRDCLPVEHSSAPAELLQPHTADARCAASNAVGLTGAELVDACVPGALGGQSDARDIVLLEQALQEAEEEAGIAISDFPRDALLRDATAKLPSCGNGCCLLRSLLISGSSITGKAVTLSSTLPLLNHSTDAGLDTLSQRCRWLHTIDISSNGKITNAGLRVLHSRCRCQFFQSASNELVNNLPQFSTLRRLNVVKCEQVTRSCVIEASQTFVNCVIVYDAI